MDLEQFVLNQGTVNDFPVDCDMALEQFVVNRRIGRDLTKNLW